MARPWERLFVGAAGLFAWCVILTPFSIVTVLMVAALAGQQRPDPLFFLGNLVVELFATLLVGVVGAVIGASIGIGTALLTQELVTGRLSQAIGAATSGLSVFPAVVLGWFGATLILPALSGHTPGAVFAAACVVVSIAVISRSNVLAVRLLGALAPSVREAAAAAGAGASRVTAHVTIPACKRQLLGIYADALSRAVGEAAGVSVVFLAAARAGYPVSLFTIPSSIMAHAHTMQLIDAGIAQSALVVLAFAATSKIIAARRIGSLQWVS